MPLILVRDLDAQPATCCSARSRPSGGAGCRQGRYEIIVVDNASGDGTAAAVAAAFPAVRVLRQDANRGPCAKNAGIAVARGEVVMFLDDDSFPADADCVPRMLAHFAADARLGAAVCTVTLPDASRECSAYPSVFIGCGTGFRVAALRQAGGLPDDFFMAAEEYDLSLRLLDAGWSIRRFDDLRVTHRKTPAARMPERVAELDVRNNLLLIARYFPGEWVVPFAPRPDRPATARPRGRTTTNPSTAASARV